MNVLKGTLIPHRCRCTESVLLLLSSAPFKLLLLRLDFRSKYVLSQIQQLLENKISFLFDIEIKWHRATLCFMRWRNEGKAISGTHLIL